MRLLFIFCYLDHICLALTATHVTLFLKRDRLKLHEDWGTTPAAIDCALRAADKHDVQVIKVVNYSGIKFHFRKSSKIPAD